MSSRDAKSDKPFYEIAGFQLLARLFANGQEPNERGINEFLDQAGGENVFEFRPVGYGLQNFPVILEAAADAGAGWVVVEQDRPSMGKTSMECAQMSREYLKKIGV